MQPEPGHHLTEKIIGLAIKQCLAWELAEADAALYCAENTGRNRVCTAIPSPATLRSRVEGERNTTPVGRVIGPVSLDIDAVLARLLAETGIPDSALRS